MLGEPRAMGLAASAASDRHAKDEKGLRGQQESSGEPGDMVTVLLCCPSVSWPGCGCRSSHPQCRSTEYCRGLRAVGGCPWLPPERRLPGPG